MRIHIGMAVWPAADAPSEGAGVHAGPKRRLHLIVHFAKCLGENRSYNDFFSMATPRTTKGAWRQLTRFEEYICL